MNKRLIRLSWLILIPILIAAVCTFRPAETDEASRIVIRGILDDIVNDLLIVTPFATFTPTPTLTPTITATLVAGSQTTTDDDGSTSGAGTDDEATAGTETGATVAAVAPTPVPVPTTTPTSVPTVTALPTSTASPTTNPTSTASPTMPPTITSTAPPDNDDGGSADPPPPPPGPPVISFSSALFNGSEGSGSAIITVVLNNAFNQVITVDFSLANGSAFQPNDYTPASGTLNFAVGETSKSFSVPIIDDIVDDPDIETVSLTLSNPTNGSLGTSSATLQIADNDPLPELSFDLPSYTVTEDLLPATFTVNLDRPTGKNIFFNIGPELPNGGTATGGGVDYNDTFDLRSFVPGVGGVSVISKSITWLGVIDDCVDMEPDETVIIELSPSSANVTVGSGFNTTLTIVDDFIQCPPPP